MTLTTLDWLIIAGFFLVSILIGVFTAKKSGQSASEFFLSGRNMPWWLLGISMVATTFSADTPNLVTDIVRKDGVSGNWVWWAFLLTGMLTVFVYAKLWRRSGILTDLEFYEFRYSGKPAAFLRMFRALYLGVFFNVMVMAGVCLAAVKIGSAMLGLDPWQTLLVSSIVTVIYSVMGGLRGVIFTDFFQFIMAMIGAIWAAYVVVNLPEIGGLDSLLSSENVAGKLSLLPDFNDSSTLIPLLIIPIAVQWWSVWYPGAEPGGGGYIAQRMLAAKDEKNAMGATLLFNVAHYSLRPWPWILIALASLVVYPMKMEISSGKKVMVTEAAQSFFSQQDNVENLSLLENGILNTLNNDELDNETKSQLQNLQQLVRSNKSNPEIQSLAHIYKSKKGDNDDWPSPVSMQSLVSLQLANPNLPISKLGHDLAYPTMLNFLPPGLLGLILASLISAFMSTISSHLNWGSSYVVNDWYKRFYKPEASEKELVNVGRISTVLLMFFAAIISLFFADAKGAFDILLQIGAGTGLIFILRWFWWRINAWSEIAAMAISFIVALGMHYFIGDSMASHIKLVLGIVITTIGWMIVTFATEPSSQDTLLNFYKKIRPASAGWKPVIEKGMQANNMNMDETNQGQLPLQILGMVIGCFTVYGFLFATGYWIYGNTTSAIIATIIAVVGAIALARILSKIEFK